MGVRRARPERVPPGRSGGGPGPDHRPHRAREPRGVLPRRDGPRRRVDPRQVRPGHPALGRGPARARHGPDRRHRLLHGRPAGHPGRGGRRRPRRRGRRLPRRWPGHRRSHQPAPDAARRARRVRLRPRRPGPLDASRGGRGARPRPRPTRDSPTPTRCTPAPRTATPWPTPRRTTPRPRSGTSRPCGTCSTARSDPPSGVVAARSRCFTRADGHLSSVRHHGRGYRRPRADPRALVPARRRVRAAGRRRRGTGRPAGRAHRRGRGGGQRLPPDGALPGGGAGRAGHAVASHGRAPRRLRQGDHPGRDGQLLRPVRDPGLPPRAERGDPGRLDPLPHLRRAGGGHLRRRVRRLHPAVQPAWRRGAVAVVDGTTPWSRSTSAPACCPEPREERPPWRSSSAPPSCSCSCGR